MDSLNTIAKILIVEDDVNLGQTSCEQIQLHGFKSFLANTAASAKVIAAAEQPHLALIDVGLPDGSGFEVARSLQQTQKAKNCSVIFLTARGDPEDRVYGLELGAEDYVVKPFHLRELLLRIRKVLQRAAYLEQRTTTNTQGNIQTLGDVTIDLSAYTLQRNQSLHRLTQRECTLLKFLLERRGQVVSRDEILDFVWSPDEYPTPRTVDNFIVRLRKLIEANPEQPKHIRSVRGVGYQIV